MYSRETGMLLRHYLEKEVGKTELAKRFGISRRTLYHWIRTAQFGSDNEAAIYKPRPLPDL